LVFEISEAIKNVLDEIDELCFFRQIAEIHKYLVAKYGSFYLNNLRIMVATV
jgi:hypothetical protein